MPAPVILHSCGIALGNLNCYVAVGRGGGIEILLNEYSQRSTPACVSFGDQQRLIGIAATQNQSVNLQNTIYNLMKLIGRTFDEYQQSRISLPFKIEPGNNGQIMVCVRHSGEERKFSITQVVGMLLTKLKEIALDAVDCVINCPNHFNESQKRALVDAARIAGLNPLLLLPDMSAIALNYAYFRTTKADKEHKILAFVDCGQSSIQTAVMWFDMQNETIRILAEDWESNLGGGDFDEILADHFVKQHNLKLNVKARLRLLAECEKLKKLLSANSNEIPINVESLESEEKDFSSKIDRAKFESLAEPLLDKIEACFQRTLKAASANFEAYKQKSGESGTMIELMFAVQAVEIVGGSSRVPAIKRLVKNVFGVEASTMLNADEAVACGCALQCASLHPIFKVKREIKITELNPPEAGGDLADGASDNQSSQQVSPGQLQGSLDEKEAIEFREIELSLIANDREWKSKMDARNNLEEFMYDWRAKLESGSCDHLIIPGCKESFLNEIRRTEDWLYDDEGQLASIKVYDDRRAELKKQFILPPPPPAPSKPSPNSKKQQKSQNQQSNKHEQSQKNGTQEAPATPDADNNNQEQPMQQDETPGEPQQQPQHQQQEQPTVQG